MPSQDSEPPVRPGDPSIKQTYFDSIDSVPEHEPLIKGTKPLRAALSLVVNGSVGWEGDTGELNLRFPELLQCWRELRALYMCDCAWIPAWRWTHKRNEHLNSHSDRGLEGLWTVRSAKQWAISCVLSGSTSSGKENKADWKRLIMLHGVNPPLPHWFLH